ncbi:MAG: L-ribulose-5-phosphate 4-epimerase AraD [Verrucomicrobiae bacterium]
MSQFASIREECCEGNRRLPGTGLVDLTFGNLSVLDPEAGAFAIKPSGMEYHKLTPADMVIVDLDGKVVEGSLRPSSDTPTHRRLFLAFAKLGIRAVVHTHSRSAVAFAQAGLGVPCLGTTHSDYFFGPVPVTRPMTQEEVRGDYEWETGNVIVERFAAGSPVEIPAVLVHSHGPFAWGVSADKAVEVAQALEAIAKMAMKTLALNPGISPVPQHLLEKHFQRKHGGTSYYGQP